MEFLRFGSSIPGSYWGCCAADIIQNFNCDPDDKASIELVSGDGGLPVSFYNDPKGRTGSKFAGMTHKDIFLQRLRYGTFGSGDMANHGFLLVLTDWQINSATGKKWLKIIKEQGFEFIRTIDNSVYTGSSLTGSRSSKPNYLFGLFRNIASGRVKDPFTPPKGWTDLDKVVPEAWEHIKDPEGLAKEQTEVHTKLWNNLPKGEFYSRKELEDAGVPVTLAGLRSKNPQEPAATREARTNLASKDAPKKAPTPAPFAKAS